MNPRVGTILFLGFSSGLPLALTSGTLQAWMATLDLDIQVIGMISLVGLPYALKFLWAPLMDRFLPPFLGRRRGWILITQIALVIGITTMGGLSPRDATLALGFLALFVAFTSASQDIAFDAYRTDVLRPRERGFGAAMSVAGYRVAMLFSGAFALILSDHIGWQNTYWLMAGVMGIGVIATLVGPEPEEVVQAPRTLHEAVLLPLVEFFTRPGSVAIVVLIVLYKLGDAFAGTLTTAFLIKALEFTATDVGTINKGMGLLATLLGAFAGGALMAKLGLFRSLLLFGVLQALTNLMFMVLATIGKSYPFMVTTVALENLAGGMGTAAFVALLMSLCNHRFTAFQYALLSALASIGRVFVGPPAGYLVTAMGWSQFFFVTFLLALPGLLLLWFLRHMMEKN